jgi:CheY-like chemotaxis protein
MTTPPFESEPIRGRILLVEDTSVYREMQCLLLQRAGYHVTTCEEAHFALLESSKRPFDVTILNSDSAGLDRPEFLAGLRRHLPALAMIYITKTLTTDQTRDLVACGVALVLERPVPPVELLQKIDQLLGITLPPAAPRHYIEPAPTETSNVASNPPFPAAGSTPPFESTPLFTSRSNPPFRSDTAYPFFAITPSIHSASPFDSVSASPFAVRR